MWDVKGGLGVNTIREPAFYLNYVGCKEELLRKQSLYSHLFYLNYVGCKVY